MKDEEIMRATTRELIDAIGIEFDKHLRIGATFGGAYFVQFHELTADGERIIAQAEGGLDDSLRWVLKTVQSERPDVGDAGREARGE
jgi:hypothetical protein